MTLLTAIERIEGMQEATEEQLLEAWSFIGKTRSYLHLQGFYGRTLSHLIESGYLDENFDIMENQDV